MAPDPTVDHPPLCFRYRNHRGEVAVRTVRQVVLWYGEVSYHPGPQWLLTALDLDRQAERTFAVTNILGVHGVARLMGKEGAGGG